MKTTAEKIIALKETLAALEKELVSELSSLPKQYGFDSTESFLLAVEAAYSPRGTKAAKVRPDGRKARAVITDETRKELKRLVQDGKTGAAIASQLKISVASVNLVKKQLGLTKPRKGK